jgi:branched-chain amino acid aminotransferase
MMYYKDDTTVFMNGAFLKAKDAACSMYAQTMHYGYAAFEGIRAYLTPQGTQMFKGREHYERLKRSCELINLPLSFTVDVLVASTYELLKQNGLKEAYIRPLVYAAEPNMSLKAPEKSDVFICAWAWDKYLGDKTLKLMISSFQRPNPKALSMQSKCSGQYVNSIVASTEAKQKGFDEALLLDMNGNIAEGPGANFFLEKDGTLYTPPTDNILNGITRKTVMELAKALNIPLKEQHLKPADLKGATGAFYTGTAAEIVGIESIDEVKFSKPFAQTLGATFAKHYSELVTGKSTVMSLCYDNVLQ